MARLVRDSSMVYKRNARVLCGGMSVNHPAKDSHMIRMPLSPEIHILTHFNQLSFLLDTYPSYLGHIPHCFQHISLEI